MPNCQLVPIPLGIAVLSPEVMKKPRTGYSWVNVVPLFVTVLFYLCIQLCRAHEEAITMASAPPVEYNG